MSSRGVIRLKTSFKRYSYYYCKTYTCFYLLPFKKCFLNFSYLTSNKLSLIRLNLASQSRLTKPVMMQTIYNHNQWKGYPSSHYLVFIFAFSMGYHARKVLFSSYLTSNILSSKPITLVSYSGKVDLRKTL